MKLATGGDQAMALLYNMVAELCGMEEKFKL